MTWSELPLGEVVTFQRGFDITKKEQKPGAYPVISSSGIGSFHSDYKVEGPGVVIGRKGSLGGVHFSAGPYWPHDTTLWVKDFHGNEPIFIYYFLQTLHLERFDTGASNPTLNRNHIHRLDVRIPSTDDQIKIASILNSYDKLIENNDRRLEILEGMAQAIYQEWLVNSRCPGHEEMRSGPHTAPLPVGWKIVKVSSVADARRGLSWNRQQETGARDGLGIVTIPNIGTRLDPRPRTRLADRALRETEIYRLKEGDILMIGSNGNPERVGQAVRVPPGVSLLFASFLMRIRPNPGTAKSLMFHQLKDLRFAAQLRSGAVGSTGLRNIRITALREAELLMPPKELRDQFEQIVAPIHALNDSLAAQNRNLARARDLLLPKLISGEIDVSEVDIDTSWLAA